LSSSLAQSVAKLWLNKITLRGQIIPFVKLLFSKIGFFSHNFGFKYARKPIKRFKDSDHSVVSKKKLEPKMS